VEVVAELLAANQDWVAMVLVQAPLKLVDQQILTQVVAAVVAADLQVAPVPEVLAVAA
jgi:hypothetical protein